MTTASDHPPLELELAWSGDLVFSGTSGEARLVLDGRQQAGPSPMQALASALAGCMAIDLVTILTKGRHELRGLHAQLVGRRAPEAPRRFLAFELRFVVNGPIPREAVDRAIQLSREKYCSVWHSLREDIAFTVTAEIAAAPAEQGLGSRDGRSAL